MPSTILARNRAETSAARERHGAFNWFASSGSPAMALGEFSRVNHLDMVNVPYKEALEALRDLSESCIQVSVIPLAAALRCRFWVHKRRSKDR